jgi:hypothetical protein
MADNGSNHYFYGDGAVLAENCTAPPIEDSLGEAPFFSNREEADYRLALGSPCIDAVNTAVADLDLCGVSRPQDGNGDGVCRADMGAQEFIHPDADADQDGLPDQWEYDVVGSVDAYDPSSDSDGDGMSMEQEYWAGTDPLDGTSVLQVAIQGASVRSSSGLAISWPSVAGRTYEVWQASSPGSSDAILLTVVDAHPPENTVWAEPGNASSGIYYVRAIPDSLSP